MMRLLACTGLLLAAGCASNRGLPQAVPLACAVGDQPMVRDLVYFGRNKPSGGEVTDVEWDGFLAEFVTPRFPEGLTVVHATGQWRGASGKVETERAEVMTLLHRGTAGQLGAISEITTEYKRRFGQEAVLRERTPVCAVF